jgi:hypothetical protein
MARATDFDELIDILRKSGWHSLKEREAKDEINSALERLRDVQKELEKQDPDAEHIADLLVPIFVQ